MSIIERDQRYLRITELNSVYPEREGEGHARLIANQYRIFSEPHMFLSLRDFSGMYFTVTQDDDYETRMPQFCAVSLNVEELKALADHIADFLKWVDQIPQELAFRDAVYASLDRKKEV